MEREVAARFGKAHGVMCNSGSSALYLAVELLDLAAGRRGRHLRAHVLDRHRADRAGGLDPGVRRLRAATRTASTSTAIEEMITDRTGAMLFPNLIGNAPDWDAHRRDRRRATTCRVIEDSCDTLGRDVCGARPTGARSTISVTSFANSHIITCAGNGGMVMVDDDALARPGRHAAALGTPVGAALLRFASGANATSGRTSTASTTTTSSSSTSWPGTSSRRRWAPRSGSSS